VATSYLLGVSTRRVEKLVETLGVTRLSTSQVSEMAKSLDAQVAAFRNRPLSRRPVRVRVAGRLDAQGPRARPGPSWSTRCSQSGSTPTASVRCWVWTWPAARTAPAGWRSCAAFLARGVAGVGLVTSGSHAGLVEAVGATLPGASWQRCRNHYARNLATEVPEGAQPGVLRLLRAVFDQPDADQVGAQFARVVEALEAKFPAAAELPGTPAALVSCQ
jgi:transposase-like protein